MEAVRRRFQRDSEGKCICIIFELVLTVYSQTGIPRTAAKTKEAVYQQVLTSLEPDVITALDMAVRESGVKDALAQPILDLLVKMGQELRKSNPEGTAHSPDEVQAILLDELKKHQTAGDGIVNPLLDMNGELSSIIQSFTVN